MRNLLMIHNYNPKYAVPVAQGFYLRQPSLGFGTARQHNSTQDLLGQ